MSIEISRRNLLKTAGGLGAASLLGLSDAEMANAASASNTVRFANWSLYLDYDNKSKNYPTLVDFTKKTGIPVKYM